MTRTIALTVIGFGLGCLLVSVSGQNPAEAVPYAATIKTSFYHVDPSGKEILRNENTRVRARDRQGRTLDGPGSDDPEHVKASIIYDQFTGKRYAVNHHGRIVRLLSERGDGRPGHVWPVRAAATGRNAVSDNSKHSLRALTGPGIRSRRTGSGHRLELRLP